MCFKCRLPLFKQGPPGNGYVISTTSGSGVGGWKTEAIGGSLMLLIVHSKQSDQQLVTSRGKEPMLFPIRLGEGHPERPRLMDKRVSTLHNAASHRGLRLRVIAMRRWSARTGDSHRQSPARVGIAQPFLRCCGGSVVLVRQNCPFKAGKEAGD